MPKTIFNPWVGKEYDNQKLKLLIVGESHYYNDEEHRKEQQGNESFTSVLLQQYLDIKELRNDRGRWTKFYTNTYNSLAHLLDISPHNTKPSEFWNKVVFYNYIQEFLSGVGVDIYPLYINNDVYKEALYKVIAQHNPDYVILLSDRLARLWKYEKCGISKDLGKKFIPAHHTSRQALSQEYREKIYKHIVQNN